MNVSYSARKGSSSQTVFVTLREGEVISGVKQLIAAFFEARLEAGTDPSPELVTEACNLFDVAPVADYLQDKYHCFARVRKITATSYEVVYDPVHSASHSSSPEVYPSATVIVSAEAATVERSWE